jgi:hypothetical protein
MAKFADRIAYRLAGLVWTAIYAGLGSRSSGVMIETGTASDDAALVDARQPAGIA